MMDEQLFLPITAEEFQAAQPTPVKATTTSRKRQPKTEPRNLTTWYTLPHTVGFCTCEQHEEIQKLLNPEQLDYRQKFPVRHTYEIREGLFICRDCFIHEGDKDD